jgi:alpha-tubulin suppressor-like RCC1 family protein
MRISRLIVVSLLALGSFAACKDSTGPKGVVVQVLSGDQQRATVGTQLPTPITVRIVDRDGPVPGQRVEFRVISGGGTIAAPTTSTNFEGTVLARWTLGLSAADSQVVEIAVVDNRTGKDITTTRVRASAISGDPAGIAVVSGNNQTAEVGTLLPQQIVVKVVDVGGNPIPNAPVGWRVASGGGTLSASNSTTDATGTARVSWTLGGQAGPQTVSAATSVGAAITFTATANPGPVAQLVIFSGNAQVDTVTQTLPEPLVVQTADKFGNPVVSAANAGVQVTFSEPAGGGSGGGTFSTPIVALDNQGRASTMWTLGTRSGAASALATALGFAGTFFSATALPAAPASISAVSALLDSATAGTQVRPQIIVRDQYGNPVPNAVIKGTIVSGGGTFEDADSAITGSNGQGAVVFVLGLTPGTNTLQETLPGLGTITFTRLGTVFVAKPDPPLPTPKSVTAGDDFSCALQAAGNALCWGAGYSASPTAVPGGLTFTAISAGDDHACGITTAGLAYCWGSNSNGQLGNGSSTTSATPVLVSGGQTWTDISAGYGYTCGVTSTGGARCWGRNQYGQLGTGGTGSTATPVGVSGVLGFTSITAGVDHTCGVTTTGAGYCWGRNQDGQIGDGTEFNIRTTPTAVAGGLTYTGLVAGGHHTCGLITSGSIYCWGSNSVGALGSGSIGGNATTPRAVRGGITFSGVAAGVDHSCGVATNGQGWCWGADFYGQLGTGLSTTTGTPLKVAGSIQFVSIDGGGNHTCGINVTGATYCWGLNRTGQLGRPVAGAQDRSNTPQAVAR